MNDLHESEGSAEGLVGVEDRLIEHRKVEQGANAVRKKWDICITTLVYRDTDRLW